MLTSISCLEDFTSDVLGVLIVLSDCRVFEVSLLGVVIGHIEGIDVRR